MARNSKVDQLQDVQLFSSCTVKELTQIARASDEVSVEAGTAIVTQGSLGHEFYLVLSGKVSVIARRRAGGRARGRPVLRGALVARRGPAQRHRHRGRSPPRCWCSASGSSPPCSTAHLVSPASCSPRWRHDCGPPTPGRQPLVESKGTSSSHSSHHSPSGRHGRSSNTWSASGVPHAGSPVAVSIAWQRPRGSRRGGPWSPRRPPKPRPRAGREPREPTTYVMAAA